MKPKIPRNVATTVRLPGALVADSGNEQTSGERGNGAVPAYQLDDVASRWTAPGAGPQLTAHVVGSANNIFVRADSGAMVMPRRKRRGQRGARTQPFLWHKSAPPLPTPASVIDPDTRQMALPLYFPARAVGILVEMQGANALPLAMGALVGPRHFLTAAHAVTVPPKDDKLKDLSTLRVLLGPYNPWPLFGGTGPTIACTDDNLINIIEVCMWPEYCQLVEKNWWNNHGWDRVTIDYAVAILSERPVAFSTGPATAGTAPITQEAQTLIDALQTQNVPNDIAGVTTPSGYGEFKVGEWSNSMLKKNMFCAYSRDSAAWIPQIQSGISFLACEEEYWGSMAISSDIVDAPSGSSGAPVFKVDGGNPTIFAIHHGGYDFGEDKGDVAGHNVAVGGEDMKELVDNAKKAFP